MTRQQRSALLMILVVGALVPRAVANVRQLRGSLPKHPMRGCAIPDQATAERAENANLATFIGRLDKCIGRGTPIRITWGPEPDNLVPASDLALIYQRAWFYLAPDHLPGRSSWELVNRSALAPGMTPVDSSGPVLGNPDRLQIFLVRTTGDAR